MAEGKREKSKKYPGVYFRVDSETGKKTYYIRYRLGGRGSKEVEEPVGKASRGMTEAKAAQVRMARMEGKSDPNTVKRAKERAVKEAEAGRWTIKRIFGAYVEAHPSQASLKSWISIFTTHIEPAMGGNEPSELVTLDVERLRLTVSKKKHSKTGKPLSAQTQKHVLSLLKRILKWAAETDRIEPATHLKFKMPSVDNLVTEAMTPDQARAYFQALDEEEDQDSAAYFRVMIMTGIRKTALLALQWSDVDFERGFLTLRGASAKSGKTQTIPMPPEVVDVLRAIPKTRSPFVWPGRDGGQRVDFQRMARRLRDKAGLPKSFRPCHGLRHAYASWLASSGEVDIYTLQRLLTHGSAAMTARYAHLADDALKRAAAVAGGILDLAQGKAVAVNEK